MNQLIIKGKLTADPELKQTPNGIAVASFSVAVNRPFKKQGEEDQADFFNCTAWRGAAETIAKYFVKGQEILIAGSMQMQRYEDKDGNKRISWSVTVDKFEFCGSKSSNSSTNNSADVERAEPSALPNSLPNDFEVVVYDDDLPF